MTKAFAAFSTMTAALALAAAPGAQAQDQAPRVFTQSGPWALDYGDDYCRLAATFEEGGDQIALALERNRTENSARLVLVGNAIRPFRNAETITYRYLPGGDDRATPYIHSQTPDGQRYFNFSMIAFGPDPAKMFAQGGRGGPQPQPAPGAQTAPGG